MIEFEILEREIAEYEQPLADVKAALHPEQTRLKIEELEMRSAQPGFWDDPDHAQSIQRELTHMKRKIEAIQELEDKFEELKLLCELGNEEEDKTLLEELRQQIKLFDKKLESLKLETYFTGELDGKDRKSVV